MRKFYRGIVDHPKLIITIFLVATLICAVLQSQVSVNYDMTAYLPEDSHSTVSLELMENEFEGGIPNARVMVRNVTIPEALEYKEKILALEGVTDVMWLDDAASIYVPMNQLDADTVETYYKDNAALFTVTIAEDKRIEAVDAIRAVIGDENAMSGQAVSTAVATTSTVNQIMIITIFAVICVLVILFITTTSWIEPLIVLGGIGVAVIINMGTNLISERSHLSPTRREVSCSLPYRSTIPFSLCTVLKNACGKIPTRKVLWLTHFVNRQPPYCQADLPPLSALSL